MHKNQNKKMTKFGNLEATSSEASKLAGLPSGTSVDVNANFSDWPSNETNSVIILRSSNNKNIFSDPKVTDQIISSIKLYTVQRGHVNTIGRGEAIWVPFKCDYQNKAENYKIVCYISKSKKQNNSNFRYYLSRYL